MSNKPIRHKIFDVPYTIMRKELYWRQIVAVSKEDAIKQVEDDFANGQIHLESTYPEYFQIDHEQIQGHDCDTGKRIN